MSDDTLRALVYGVGHLGRHHARIYHQLPGVELVGVVDPDAAARERCAESLGVPTLEPGDSLPEFDLASVAAPTSLHHELAAPLLDRGVHVLVEKPLSNDLGEAQDLVRRADASGAVLCVGHVERFNPVLQAALHVELDPRYIEVHRVSPFSFRSADIGVVLDMMIHDLDVLLALVGREVVEVRAVGAALIGVHEDVASARLQFAGGCVANVTASRAALKTERKFRIFSPGSYLSLDFGGKSAIKVTRSEKVSASSLGVDPASPGDLRRLAGQVSFADLLDVQRLPLDEEEPLRAELEAFVASVRGAPPVVSGEEGCEAVALASRILEAIREHRWE
jgi:predicted dehydrogenase